MRAIAIALIFCVMGVFAGCDGEGGPISGSAPQAMLAVSRTSGPAVLEVVFDAGESVSFSDITRYEWDFNDDDVYEYDSGAEPTTSFFYYTPGRYHVTMRVTNADGLSATAIANIDVGPGAKWDIAAHSFGSAISQAVMLEVEGAPALFIVERIDANNWRAAYVRAADARGETWGTPVELATMTGLHAEATSISCAAPRIMNGVPTVVLQVHGWFRWSGWSASFMVRALDSAGTSWSAPQDIGIGAGITDSVVLAGGRPAYIDFSGGMGGSARCYSHAVDASGAVGDSSIAWVNFNGWVPFADASLELVSGRPALAVGDASRGLCYMRARDTLGNAWPVEEAVIDEWTTLTRVPLIVDALGLTGAPPEGDTGYSISPNLFMAGANPAIAYLDARTMEVRYVRALDPAGATWGGSRTLAAGTLDENGYPGGVSVTQFEGRPVVLYHSGASEVSFIAANNAEGTSWSFPVPVQIQEPYPGSLCEMCGCLNFCMASSPEGGVCLTGAYR